MTTEEWVSADSEIWDYDQRDDFIWLPELFFDGLGVYVASSTVFQFVANQETFEYVANRSN